MADTELHETAGPQRIEGLLHRLWRGILVFLEIIGLREGQEVSREEQLARLRLYHTEFRKLISANHSFLETLGDLEEKRLGHQLHRSISRQTQSCRRPVSRARYGPKHQCDIG